MSRADKQITKELLEQCQQGEQEAFYGLYQILHPPLFRFLLARTRIREDAQDILQDLFLDLWRSLAKFNYKNEAQFYGFVYKIARRKLSKYYQNKPTEELAADNILANYEFFPEDFGEIRKAVNFLEDKYREVIELRYWSQMSFREIATTLGLRENNAKVRHHRALQKMQELLNQND